MEDCCAVCAEPLEWLAYGPCLHSEVCSTCTARLRFILDDKCCCICKQECPTVFVTKALGDYTKIIKDFTTLPAGANEGKVGDYWFHSDTEAYFDEEIHYKMIKDMCRLSCSVCESTVPKEPGNESQKRDREFKHIDQLRRHLYHVHKLSMCTLCLEGRKVFIGEHKLYTRAQLDRHLAKGDSEVDGSEIERGGFMGHPICDFCKKRFYGDNELYTHMQTEHYTCHICQRRNPGHYDYYRNYNDLEAHFSQVHLLCENPDCLAKKFIVFSTESELKRHNAIEHAGNMSRSQRNAALQIPVSFQYRRPVDERESHRGSRGRGRGRNMNDRPSAANQASSEMFNLESAIHESLLTATFENVSSSVDSDPMPPLPNSDASASFSTSTLPSEPPRYLTAVSRRELNSALDESAFPPLPGVSDNVGQSSKNKGKKSSKSIASLVRGGRGNVRVLNTSIPGHSVGPALLSSSPPVSSFVSQTNSNRNMNHLERPLMPNINGVHTRPLIKANGRETVPRPDEFPPILGSQNVAIVPGTESQSTVTNVVPPLTMEETQAANKALVESIRSCLGGNKEQFTAFKDLSAQFRNGNIDARKYYKHISKLGLSHLVLELARLCPDKDKQRELLEAHNAALKRPQHNVNPITSQIRATSITSNSVENHRKGKNVDAGCSEDVTSSFSSNSASCVENASAEAEVLSKDGYRSAGGKSKPWEMQSLKASGSNVLSSDEQANHHQRSLPVLDNPTPSSGEKWSCNACTLINTANSMLCAVCGSERPYGLAKELSSGVKVKQKKKTSKSQRGRLLDLSGTSQSSQNASGGSVWGNGGGQRLLSVAQRDAVDDNLRR